MTLYCLFGLCTAGFGQVQLISASDGGFENATSTFSANGWTVVNGNSPNWYVGTAAGSNSGTKAAFTGTNSSNFSGGSGNTVDHFYRDIAIPAGATNISLGFYLIFQNTDPNGDFLNVYTTTTARTPVGNTIPTTGYTNVYSNTSNTFNTFSLQTVTLPNSLAGTTVRLVFTFISDFGFPYAMAALDDISLSYSGIPSVSTNTITAITNTSALSGGNTLSQGASSITAKGVVWGLSVNPTVPSANSTNDGSGTANYTSTLSGLSPQTLYNVRAYATNGSGTGYGSDLNFYTLSNPVTAQPTSFTATPASASVVLNWNAATYPGTGATGTGYLVLYSTGTPTLTSANGNAPSGGAGTTIVNITNGATLTTTVSSLTNGTLYNFLLIPYTWNGVNAATYNYLTSGDLTASATPVALPSVTTSPIISITSTTASSGGSSLAANGSSITAKGVVWGLSANPTIPSANSTNDGTGTANYTSSITGLSPQTQYNLRAYATNSAGTGYGSNLTFFTLSSPVISQPTSFIATPANLSAVLNWNAATYPVSGATGTGYLVLYSTGTPTLTSVNGSAPSGGTGTTMVNITSGATLTTTISSLTNGTLYNFLLIPYTWDGTNAGTYNYLTVGALTATAIPAGIPSVTTRPITAITSSSATSGGSGLSSNGASITAKGVVWGLSANPTVPSANSTSDGTGTGTYSSSVTGLSPQTLYNIRAYVINSAGTGYGNNLTFYTLSSPVSAQPTSFTATPGNSSAVLNWNSATYPASGATGNGYLLLYSTGTPTLSSANGTAPAGGVGTTLVNITSGATLTYTLNGLNNGATYNFLLVPYTWDGTNNGTYNYLTAGALTTCTVLTPNQPGGLTLPTATTTTSITGSITAASPAPTGYVILYSTSNTIPTPVDGTVYNAAGSPYVIGGVTYSALNTLSAGNFTINGLTSATTYYVFVYSYSNTSCGTTPIYSGGFVFGNATTAIASWYLGSSGTADLLSSWWSNTNSTGSHPANFTAAGVTFNVINQANPSLGGNWTVSGSGSAINIGDGSANTPTLTVGSNYVLNATVNILANSTLYLSTTGSLNGIVAGSLDPTSTVNFASTGPQTIPALNYGNLTSSSTGARTLSSSGTIGVSGVFTPGTNNYTITGSLINFNGTNQTVPAVSTFSFYDLAVSNSNSGNSTILAPGTINIADNFTDGNAGIYVTTGNTVNFTGGAITIPAIFPAYNNVTYSGSANSGNPANFSSGATINGTFTVSSGYFAMDASILYTHTINNMAISGSAQVDLAENGNFPAVVNLTGNFIQTGGSANNPGLLSSTVTGNGTLNFAGTGTVQNFSANAIQDVNININSPSYVVLNGNVNLEGGSFFGGFITVNMPLTINSGATLDCGTYFIKDINSTARSSYLNLNAGGILEIGDPNGIQCLTSSATRQTGTTGNIQTSYRVFNSGATYVYKGTVAQHSGVFATSSNPKIANLYIENAAGVTMQQLTTITGSLNIGYSPSSATTITAVPSSSLNDGGFQISSISPAVLNLGDVPYVNTVFSNASKLVLGSSSSATSFPAFTTVNIGSGTTVQYAAGVAQTVSSSPAYYNIAFSGNSAKTLNGALSAYGNLSILAGSLNTSGSGYGITLGGSWTNTGGSFVPHNSTVTFNGSTGATTTQVETSTQSLNSGGSSFYNVVHNNNYTLQLAVNPLATTGNFTNSAGTFDANALAHTVSLVSTISGGTYLASTNTQSFNGGLLVSGGIFTGSTGTVNSGNVTLSSGTLTAPSGPFNVQGNWLQSGGLFDPGTNTVSFTLGSGTQTINTGGVPNSSFYNINHSGAGTALIFTNSLVTGGTFTNAAGSGNFDANTQIHTVTGLATVNGGNYLASTNTQNFNGGLTVSGGNFTGSTGNVNTTNVTISSGTLQAPSTLMSVTGNWLFNGGVFTHNNGLVNFSGTSLQTIGGTHSASFYDLENSNATGISIISAAGTFVNDNLNLAAGVINTSNSFLLTMNAGSSVTVANALSGVPQANSPYINGPLQKVGNTDFIFPVGVTAAGTGAVPIGISSSSGSSTDVFRAEYRHESAGLLFTYYNPLPNASLFLDHVSRCDYWTLKLVSGTPTVSVTGYWNSNNLCLGQTPGDPSHYVNNLSDIGLAHYDSTNLYWDKFGGFQGYLGGNSTATGTDLLGSVTLTNVSSFSPFALGSGTIDNPLPVLLVNFEAVLNPDKTVGLSWTTQQEVGMSHFEVERSADGQHWSSIGKVNARGNSAVPTDYVFTDQAPLSGANYYRIRMVNLDNISGLTRIRVVRILQVKGVSVYPVPARDFVNITVSGATVDLNIRLVNQLGQVMQVSQVKAGTSTTITLDVHNYAQGSYLLQVMGADGTQQTSKVVIMR